MGSTAALALIATTVIVLALATAAGIRYLSDVLEGDEEDEGENSRPRHGTAG